jgi:uncharacterized protein YecT (DUF1311 family)
MVAMNDRLLIIGLLTVAAGTGAASVSSARYSSAENERDFYSKRYQSCSDRAEGSSTRITGCESEEQALQESRLNQAYAKIMRDLSPSKKHVLRQSERQWLIMREKKCALAPGDIGLSDLVDSMLCRLDETIRRTIWLRHYRELPYR